MPHGIRLSPPTQPIRRRFRPLVYRHAHIASHGHMSTSPNFLHPSLVDNPLYYSIHPSLCHVYAVPLASHHILHRQQSKAKQSTAQPSAAQHTCSCSCSAIPSLLLKHHQPCSLPLPHAHSTLPAFLRSGFGAMGGGVQEEEAAGAPHTAAMVVPPVLVKGKRSKRQRVHAPPVVLSSAAPEWSSSAASAATAPAEEESGTSRSDEAASSAGCLTEEDEDMALCLMLLARGVPAAAKDDEGVVVAVAAKEARFRSRRPADGAAAGEYVYQCKTCDKCFPSFQALGGHRTSHKKPRLLPPPLALASEDTKAAAAAEPAAPSPTSLPPTPPPPAEATAADATVLAIAVTVPVAPKQEHDAGAVAVKAAAAFIAASSSSKHHPRVHECSLCGAEFGSGQALGGHMRRHRPLVPAAARDDAPRKEKSLLELDLNMPAPCDEAETSPRFAFAAERPPAALLFPASAASALVDCHY
ncbi:zinc finger protein ZAT5-like [Panicum virgatum]|uniref:C2H2-type domain-containing protein n=1 Tax=Panicum virgatum TaxID=38727 RepID=A0A8T0Q9J8_PANVG|nr:zinc finger protein ZAT5-like [Panicum virgatum]KAG2570593.1 hypothetical protein PVAP13_7KG020709 [Panicum virgatum]